MPCLVGTGILLVLIVLGPTVFPRIAIYGPTFLAHVNFRYLPTIAMILTAVAGLALGQLITLGRGRPVGVRSLQAPVLRIASPGRRGLIVFAAIALTWVSMWLMVLGIGGFSAVMQRPGYLIYSGNNILMGMGNTLTLVAGAGLGYASGLPEGKRRRIIIAITFVLLFLLVFSTASRRLGLIPLLFWIGRCLGGPTRRRVVVGLPLAIVAGLFLSGVALTLRGLDGSGFRIYRDYFLSNPGAIGASLARLFGNLLAPFPYTAMAAAQPTLSSADFWVCINPLPSAFIGYDALMPDMQFFAKHPYPAVGVLFNYGGYRTVFFITLGIGMVLGFAARVARKLSGRATAIAAVALLAANAYISLLLVQYSLRQTARIAWYTLIVVLLANLMLGPLARRRAAREQRLLDDEALSAARQARSSEVGELGGVGAVGALPQFARSGASTELDVVRSNGHHR